MIDRHLCHQTCFHLLCSKSASDFNSSIGWKAKAFTLNPNKHAESFFLVNAFPLTLSYTLGFSSCSMIQLNDLAPNLVDMLRSNGEGLPPRCMYPIIVDFVSKIPFPSSQYRALINSVLYASFAFSFLKIIPLSIRWWFIFRTTISN